MLQPEPLSGMGFAAPRITLLRRICCSLHDFLAGEHTAAYTTLWHGRYCSLIAFLAEETFEACITSWQGVWCSLHQHTGKGALGACITTQQGMLQHCAAGHRKELNWAVQSNYPMLQGTGITRTQVLCLCECHMLHCAQPPGSPDVEEFHNPHL